MAVLVINYMDEVKKTIKKVLKAMGVEDADIEIKKDNMVKEKEVLVADIDMPFRDAKQFLNEDGEGITALQHILRRMLHKEDPVLPLLTIDINRHRKEREKELAELAVKAAQKVRRTKKPVMLKSMPAYERRFIHMKLAEQPDIVTESTGEEPERRIVVRLYP